MRGAAAAVMIIIIATGEIFDQSVGVIQVGRSNCSVRVIFLDQIPAVPHVVSCRLTRDAPAYLPVQAVVCEGHYHTILARCEQTILCVIEVDGAVKVSGHIPVIIVSGWLLRRRSGRRVWAHKVILQSTSDVLV